MRTAWQGGQLGLCHRARRRSTIPIVNAYTSNHDKLESADIGTLTRVGLHMIDAVGVVHAAILRLQAILLRVRTLVLSGGH
jgi:hypothetical protein